MTLIAPRVVLYGIGSPLVVDAEESCARAGVPIEAGVHNVDGPVYVTDAVRVIARADVGARERACAIVVALFTPGHRQAAVEDARAAGFALGATLVDPTAAVARTSTLGEGVYVNAGSVVAGACAIEAWVLVNRSASIGHHARIGAYASIGPGAVLCGSVVVGRGAVVGAGSVVHPGVEIGANAIVAAGSVVHDNVPPNSIAEGNPCRIKRADVAGYNRVAVRGP
ncbi:MAG TPA: acetyltransferase [Casimicrobiaceae bacterium]